MRSADARSGRFGGRAEEGEGEGKRAEGAERVAQCVCSFSDLLVGHWCDCGDGGFSLARAFLFFNSGKGDSAGGGHCRTEEKKERGRSEAEKERTRAWLKRNKISESFFSFSIFVVAHSVSSLPECPPVEERETHRCCCCCCCCCVAARGSLLRLCGLWSTGPSCPRFFLGAPSLPCLISARWPKVALRLCCRACGFEGQSTAPSLFVFLRCAVSRLAVQCPECCPRSRWPPLPPTHAPG